MEDETTVVDPETPEVEAPETEVPAEETPAKHPFFDRMKQYNPEAADDNSSFDTALGKIDELDGKLKEAEISSKQVLDAIDADPLFGAILSDYFAGATFIQALAKHIDPEDLEVAQGEPDYEGWAKNKDERISKKAENDQLLSEISENISASQTTIEEFATEKGMDEAAKMAFVDSITKDLEDAYKGKISKEFLAKQYVADNHEKEVAAEAEAAFIDGKNQAIEATRIKSATEKSGDGVPSITGVSANKTEAPAPAAKSEIEMIAERDAAKRKF